MEACNHGLPFNRFKPPNELKLVTTAFPPQKLSSNPIFTCTSLKINVANRVVLLDFSAVKVRILAQNEADFAVVAGRYNKKYNEITTQKTFFNNRYSSTKQLQ